MYNYDKDDIVALATPPGKGAIAIIRLSGKNLISLYKILCKKSPKNRFASFVKIKHPKTNKILDETLVTYFKGPNSYTGEDVIEISCHGGYIIPNSIINVLIDSGVRKAMPGEFSFRAFMNGKIDLVQAESISSIISAKSNLAANIALNHLEGKVSKLFNKIKYSSLNMISILENELNFSEEEIELTTYNEISIWAKNIKEYILDILNSSTFGQNILSGFNVVIVGKANSGKSSLFNSILGYERSIVSSRAGTTRDTIEANIELLGVPVTLVDTAGVWESDDYLDSLGIKKTNTAIKNANICVIVDELNPKKIFAKTFSKIFSKEYIFVKSKCDNIVKDLKTKNNVHKISSLKNLGIDKLITEISTHIKLTVDNKKPLDLALITKRQISLLKSSLLIIDEILTHSLNGIETDIIVSSIRAFINNIKEVIGEVPEEEIINNIFSNFCIGK